MKNGLRLLPPDNRDFRFGEIYTLPKLSELPASFMVMAPLVIKDQKETDFCADFAGTAVSEDQEGVILDPLYQVYRTRNGDTGFGADLRSVCKGLTKYGSLEQKDAVYKITDNRENIIFGKKYTSKHDSLASKHKKGSFMAVTGPYDFFDNIRATIWKNRLANESVLMGVNWCPEWLDAPNAVINSMGTPTVGHAIKIMGWVTINSKLYLQAQLSNGDKIGANGIFYFSREVINLFSSYGAFTFTDLPVESAQYYHDNAVKADLNWLARLILILLDLIKKKR